MMFRSEILMINYEYNIDEYDKISYMNESWLDFSKANQAKNLTLPEVLGRSVWSYINNRETKAIYQIIVNNVRKGGIYFSFPFRADSPDKRRFMELHVSPIKDNGVCFNSVLLQEERRSYVTLLDSNIKRKSSFVIMCSWCKTVNVSREHWIDIEAAVKFLNLPKYAPYPKISHRICPACSSRLRTEIINTRRVNSQHDESLFVV